MRSCTSGPTLGSCRGGVNRQPCCSRGHAWPGLLRAVRRRLPASLRHLPDNLPRALVWINPYQQYLQVLGTKRVDASVFPIPQALARSGWVNGEAYINVEHRRVCIYVIVVRLERREWKHTRPAEQMRSRIPGLHKNTPIGPSGNPQIQLHKDDEYESVFNMVCPRSAKHTLVG